MIVTGQGGTGKSVLVDAITETFSHFQSGAALAKCGTTGVAATQISGTTLHSWVGLGIGRLKSVTSASKVTTARRKKNILGKTCLIIDEMSMLYDTLFTDVDKIISFIKKSEHEGNEFLPFGGMHVILMGDFHQFPPVARPHSALYSLHPTSDADALW